VPLAAPVAGASRTTIQQKVDACILKKTHWRKSTLESHRPFLRLFTEFCGKRRETYMDEIDRPEQAGRKV
jgi:hypothetical protein